ncbi:MAG: hypothetical protein ACFFDO_02225, partial [Candidatus Thorarchaeota archaeon]
MKALNLENSMKTNLLLLSFLLISLFPFFISPKYNVVSLKSNNDEILASQDFIYDIIGKDDSNIDDWEAMILKFDQNSNGISDQFEEKLYSAKKSYNKEDLISNYINIIIKFPDVYDYSTAISLFESNGGQIRHKFKDAFNGFAGKIDSNRF